MASGQKPDFRYPIYPQIISFSDKQKVSSRGTIVDNFRYPILAQKTGNLSGFFMSQIYRGQTPVSFAEVCPFLMAFYTLQNP